MTTPKGLDVDAFQFCLTRGVIPLPFVYSRFLDVLKGQERNHKLCLVPSSRFELFHLKLNLPKVIQSKPKERIAG